MPVFPPIINLTSAIIDGLTGANSLSATYPAITKKDLDTNQIAGVVGGNSISNTYPVITKKDLDANQIAGVVGGNSISNTYPVITKKDISSDQIAGIANSASMSASNVAATMNDLLARVPAGCGMEWYASTPPAGWLEVNGAVISRTTYAALFATIGTTFGAGDGSTTFGLPETRGEFLRGFSNGRAGVDVGRVFGSWQDMQTYIGSQIYCDADASWNITVSAGTNDSRLNYTDNETRPRNLAIMYIIKY